MLRCEVKVKTESWSRFFACADFGDFASQFRLSIGWRIRQYELFLNDRILLTTFFCNFLISHSSLDCWTKQFRNNGNIIDLIFQSCIVSASRLYIFLIVNRWNNEIVVLEQLLRPPVSLSRIERAHSLSLYVSRLAHESIFGCFSEKKKSKPKKKFPVRNQRY